jgi:alkylation response protein AidB-like acyl-CoA dehydrogenase
LKGRDFQVNTFLNATQEAQRNGFLDYARQTVAPKARALENHSTCLKEFLQSMGHAGYLGITVPKEYGGQGGTLLDFVFFVEAIAQYEPGLGLTLANHVAVIEVIKKYGNDTHKSRYLPLLSRGEAFASLAFSEETAGTDFENVKTIAADEDGQPVLTGTKARVVTGDFATVLLVLARTPSEVGELTLVVADAERGKGMQVEKERRLLGLRSSYCNDMSFKSLKVAAENRLSKGSQSREQALFAMDVAKVIVAAAAVGVTEGATGLAVEHARSRQQFGVNIGQFQGVQWKLADMAVEAGGARLQTYRAAWAHGEDEENFSRFAAMSKLFAARAARLHTGEAMQVMGAAGIDGESPLERFYRDAKTMEVAMGTAEFQKLLLVEDLDI